MIDKILLHYKQNLFRLHLLSWMLVSIPFAFLISPEFSLVCGISYGISAVFFCTLLCVITYPFSGHYSFTILGAITGGVLAGLTSIVGPVSNQNILVSLLIGGIVGSTSVIWRLPLQILRHIKKEIRC